jgi:hypothetical protein
VGSLFIRRFFLAFAKLAKALPNDADPEDKEVKKIRNRYKQCCLAILYGQEAHGLATRINQSPILAQRLIDQHKNMFPVFWKWSARTVNQTMYMNKLWTRLGWVLHVQEGVLNLEMPTKPNATGSRKRGTTPMFDPWPISKCKATDRTFCELRVSTPWRMGCPSLLRCTTPL